jgi:replicative DNA helicase
MKPVTTTAAGNEDQDAIEALDSAAFNAATFPKEWLIEGVLVRGQPGVLGGPKKTLKTSLMIDMAVSIGTGQPFLGHFPVPRCRRVAVFSGESDAATLQDTARRVCAARGVSLGDCRVLWGLRLPRLSQKGQRLALRRLLRANKVQVVFIDPLYLCLLDGSRSLSASNLYDVGPLLWRAARACLDAGATPLVLHHATKAAAKRPGDPSGALDLDDLAFAGVAEFARQWVLLSRREPFRPEVGRHRLVLATGGSAGHAGRWDLTVEEGVLGKDFAGRTWQVTVEEATEASDAGRRGRRQRRRSEGGALDRDFA